MKTPKACFRILRPVTLLLVGLTTICSPPSTHSQGTTFTYQGQLLENGIPANGNYDLTFGIWTDPSGPAQVGSSSTWLEVPVTNGLFTLPLDFGSSVFTNADRWLEIAVRTNGSEAFTTLAPRQQITAAPYAIRAANFTGAVTDSQLSANIARLNAEQSFSATNRFNNRVRISTPLIAALDVRTGDSSGNAIRFGYNSGGGAGNLIAGLARVAIATDNLVERLVIRQDSGNVGIGLTGPNYQLQLSTDSAAKPNGGSWSNSSDARIKKNIQPLTGALEKLTQLHGVSFEWVHPDEHANQTGRQAGFVAQEVERVFPNWVQEVRGAEHDALLTQDGKVKSLSLPFEFDALTVEALRELRAENSALKHRLEKLERLLDEKRADAK